MVVVSEKCHPCTAVTQSIAHCVVTMHPSPQRIIILLNRELNREIDNNASNLLVILFACLRPLPSPITAREGGGRITKV